MASEPRPWKECPECLGYGTLLQHPGSHKSTAHMGATGTDGWPAIPCPTCAAHWRGVDEALHASVLDDSDVTAAYSRGKAEGVRKEREACAVVVDALATKLATTVHECAHELGLACAICDASREAHATVSALRARGGDGKGGA